MLVLALSMMFVASASAMDGNALNGMNKAVYTETNSLKDNRIVSFDRMADGSLTMSGSFSTKGLGTGVSLGNAGGVILTDDGKYLLAVNARSNEISVFAVKSSGLKFTDKVNSGGTMPISLTVNDNIVYVLNAGGNGNIEGFHLNDGKLSMIPDSVKPLSSNSAGPAEISFNPSGNVLVVTEKNTNMIDTYTVNKHGVASAPMAQASNGATPFGFTFTEKGILIVTEAPGSALSSYSIDKYGKLKLISGSIADNRAAACWVAVTKDGKFAFANNAHDGTISNYMVSNKGKLSLIESLAATSGNGNTDMALSENSKFLYSLNAADGTIAIFKIKSDGSLVSVGTVNVPAGSEGLAAI